MADLSIYYCTPRTIRSHMIRIIRAGLVPFIRSSPGMGKSAIIKSVFDEFRLKRIDTRMSQATPEDLQGLPEFYDIMWDVPPDDPRHGTVRRRAARFVPFDTFPIESDPIPEGYNGWGLFFDEFNSGSEAVQAACYKILLDREVGPYPLHPNVVIVLAGNLATDRAIVNDLSTALQSRVVHLIMINETEEFIRTVAYPQGWDNRIISYLAWKGDKALHDFRPDHDEHTFCCPRTWEFMNRLLVGYNEDGSTFPLPVTDADASLFAGTITSGEAVGFIQFTKVFATLPQISQIERDPQTAPMPADTASSYATMVHLTERTTATNFKAVAEYVERFDRVEFRVLFYRGLINRKPEIKRVPEFARHVLKIQKYLHDDENELIDNSRAA